MKLRPLGTSGLLAAPIALGTWPMAGLGWSGVTEQDSIATIHKAVGLGVNLIDTAYMYGKQGEAEQLVGKAIQGQRDKVLIATKGGLEWRNGERVTDCSCRRLLEQAEESLRRMNLDVIDLYQVHTPDPNVPVEETARAMLRLHEQGKIRAIGVSNYSVKQMTAFLRVAPIHAAQALYNMLRREIEADLLPFCHERGIAVLVYRPLERGLLTDQIRPASSFPADDSRRAKPEWQGEEFQRTLALVERLRPIAAEANKTLAQLVLNWTIHQPGVTAAICGAKRPEQVVENVGGANWRLTDAQKARIRVIGLPGSVTGQSCVGRPHQLR